MNQTANVDITVTGNIAEGFDRILTEEALQFVGNLQQTFGDRIATLLETRKTFQAELDAGKRLDFLPETKHIRESDWQVNPIPKDLQDRRVEITGPVDRKMMINALNSGAKVFMADLEDSLTPGWEQVIQGQINLYDAVRGQIAFTSPEGKEYSLKGDYPSEDLAIMIVRPRGWHLEEKHVEVGGKPIAGALLDFGLYFFHNAHELIKRGTAPYFYLPKLEHYQEAALWNDIFIFAQNHFNIPVGTIKATVLIETITAAFEMEEILHALKEHIVAQNAGRWDYIFSYIKCHSMNSDFVCPDRGQVVMTQPFLRNYSLLLIQTCHKRGAFAMGGMAAFIPIKNDEEANNAAISNVKKDKEREAGDGHDGTWVAHPGLIPIAKEAFDRLMPTPNQVHNKRDDVTVTADNLLEVPTGTISEAGLRNNISVGIQYIADWLNGNGCVPIFNLMEDAATAEIARTQIWQWIKHSCHFGDVPQSGDGKAITETLYQQYKTEELQKIQESLGADAFSAKPFERAAALLDELVLADSIDAFLTLKAYEEVAK